jgi:sulfate adenylyltransferase
MTQIDPTRPTITDHDASPELLRLAATLPKWAVDARQACDLELILSGGFAPLTGFLGERDWESVLTRMRLADGALWPIPVVLDVDRAFAERVEIGGRIALTDGEGIPLALMTIGDRFEPDRAAEAQAVFGTVDPAHPGVADTLGRRPICLGGTVTTLRRPVHLDFPHLRHTPAELRALLAAAGGPRVVAFQTRNPLHCAHVEMTRRAADSLDATLLLHPAVGRTKPGDIDHFTRVRCYEAILPRYAPRPVVLSLLPLAMRMAGPREALWHSIIRRNHGATHFIVGRDHAGPGNDPSGRPWYPPLAAQELALEHAAEVGIDIVAFPAVVWAANRKLHVRVDELTSDDTVEDLSGTELRRRLLTGEPVPDWFSYPEVAQVLREATTAARAGCCVFLTGLPASGKSTVARALAARWMEDSARPVTVLDGDEVRRHLSKGLGFSREDRDANVERIGWVAAEIVRHGGFVVCAQIAPYAGSRAEARRLVERYGRFVEVHVATTLDECERRDPKGLYALARGGKLSGFTGIDDPYEVPTAPDLVIDTASIEPRAAADQILAAVRAGSPAR